MSPQATLQRGYAIVSRDHTTVTAVGQTGVGDRLTVQLVDGRIGVDVTSVEEAP